MKNATFILLVSTMAVFAACHGSAQIQGPTNARINSSGKPQQQSSSLSASDAQDLCNRVPAIKVLPFKGDKGIDPAYDALILAGDSVVPCLIDKTADTTPMMDPRETPKFSGTTVGDVAYFVLVDSTSIDFIELLPPEVKKAYSDEGVYAYFRFVEKPENRLKLQEKLREWYKNSRGQSSLAPVKRR